MTSEAADESQDDVEVMSPSDGSAPERETGQETDASPEEEPASPRAGLGPLFEARRSTRVLIAVISVLAIALAALAVVGLREGDDDPAAGRRIPQGEIAVPADRPVLLSPSEAQKGAAAAAESASTIFATSYQDYDDQAAEAAELMTPAFATKFRTTAADIKDAFVAAKTEVQVRVVAQSVVRANRSQLQALLFLNQYTTKDGKDTTYSPYRVLVTVVNTDRGWLVSDIDTR